MKKLICAIYAICAAVIVFAGGLFFSCKYGASNPFYYGYDVDVRTEQMKDIVGEAANGVSGEYSVIIITDKHTGDDDCSAADEAFFNWVGARAAEGKLPAFCISLGDVTDGGREGQMDDYVGFTSKLYNDFGIKTYSTCGNHDMYQYSWERWENKIYPYTGFFRIKAQNSSFYALDTATGLIGNSQMKQIQSNFQNDANPKFVFSHYPVYTKTNKFALEDTFERNTLLQLMAQNNVKLYFAGHFHIYEQIDFGNFVTYTVPSYCESKAWALLEIDENLNSYKFSIIYG